jgi:hypothetical protein
MLGEGDLFLYSSFLEIQYTIQPSDSTIRFPLEKYFSSTKDDWYTLHGIYKTLDKELQKILYPKVRFFEKMFYECRCKKLYFYRVLANKQVLICGIQFEICTRRFDSITKKLLPSTETNPPRIKFPTGEIKDALKVYINSIGEFDQEDTTFTYTSVNHREPTLKFGMEKNVHGGRNVNYYTYRYYVLDNENDFYGLNNFIEKKV